MYAELPVYTELLGNLGDATTALLNQILMDLEPVDRAHVVETVTSGAGRARIAVDTGKSPIIMAVLSYHDDRKAMVLYTVTFADPIEPTDLVA